MLFLLIFGITLTMGLLLSEFANRTLFSTAVLFLLVGCVAGPGLLGWIEIDAKLSWIEDLLSAALFSILYLEGLLVEWTTLKESWREPGRAVLVGLPLTIGLNTLLARLIFGFSWMECFLLGTALGPTDPVFAAGLVGQESVPRKLKHFLNIESGINDGIALPILLVALGGWVPTKHSDILRLLLESVGGIGIGICLPWILLSLEGRRILSLAESSQPLYLLAIGILVFALSSLTGTNSFLGAFAAGITAMNLSPRLSRAFKPAGQTLGETVKLFTLFVFGGVVSHQIFHNWNGMDIFYTLAILVLVRPIALFVALGSKYLDPEQWWTAAWFGPKGFASIFYGLLILRAGIPSVSQDVFRVIAVVTFVSIVLHSSSDVPIARWLSRAQNEKPTQ